jgi:hypothetical protein
MRHSFNVMNVEGARRAREAQFYFQNEDRGGRPHNEIGSIVSVQAVCSESRTYGYEGVRVYTWSVDGSLCRPICSMIYGSTGITNFEESAKTFTGYEITLLSAQSSGIFMGIPFIAVGFLSKITAVSFRAAVRRPVGTGRLRPISVLSGRLMLCCWSVEPITTS